MSPVLLNPSRFASGGTTIGQGSAAALDAAIAADTPWGFWKNTEASGNPADSSGNARTMTATGTLVYSQAGPWGGSTAIKYPDSSGGSEFYAKTAVAFNTSTATLEAFVYLTAYPTNQTGLLCCGSSYGGGGVDKYLYIGTDGAPRYYIFNAGQLTITGTPLALNTWNHVVASTGAAGTKLRVNKATVASNVSTGSTASASAFLFMHGGGSDGTSFDAINPTNSSEIILSRCAAYTSQLSDARVDAHYDAA